MELSRAADGVSRDNEAFLAGARMSHTARAMERADQSDWGRRRGPSLWERACLSLAPVAGAAWAVGVAWAGPLWLSDMARERAWPGWEREALWALWGAQAALIGLLSMAAGEWAKGAALGASWAARARVAKETLPIAFWMCAGFLAAFVQIPVWIAGSALRLFGGPKRWALSPFDGLADRWAMRAALDLRERMPVIRAREYGPLAAWAEVSAAATGGHPGAIRAAMRAWGEAPFDPGWEALSGEGGWLRRGPGQSFMSWAQRCRPPKGAPGEGLWPDEAAMAAALERAELSRQTPQAPSRERTAARL